MLSSLKTLKDLESTVTKPASSSGPRKYFSINSGESFKIRFRQELTEDGKFYDEETGAGAIVNVITSPINWKWRIASTSQSAEHGYRCWGTEQVATDKRWRPKPHLLINIAVETEPGTWEPRVLDTTFNQRHIGLIMLEYAKEFGTITDRYYKYSRTGTGASDTNYSLIPLEAGPTPEVISSLPMHSLDSMYMTLPYDKQQTFLTTGEFKDAW
jgi:hypothetical protein